MKDNILIELTNLMNDTYSNKVALFESENTAKYTDQAIRETFYEILGNDKLTWQGWRNHKNEIFTVMENVLTTNLPLAWEGSRFYDQFVEVKNAALGDKNEFVVEDNSVLAVSRFSGNTWDVDRQKLQGKKGFSVPTDWSYIRVYDDLERFLKGTITLPQMINKMQSSLQKDIDARIVTAFNGAGDSLPAQFQESGSYDKFVMTELIQRVQTASSKEVVLAGTKRALASIITANEAALLSESQKEEIATKGALLNLTGLGVQGIEIPQAFVRGTYNFSVRNDVIYVLPNDEKIIKLFYEGDTRARELGEKDTHDQTIDTQVQTKLGVGVVFNNLFGQYNIV